MNGSNWMHQMTWVEVENYLANDDIVLVPVGATEQHGRHMALFTDTEWAIGMSEGAAELEKVLIAPPVHYGWGPHHMAYKGTITLRAETLTQLCVDIGESLAFQGFRKIVFVNGNRVANLPAMQIAASKLRHLTGAFVAVVDAGLLARRQIREICTSEAGGLGHAGESETAYMLHRHPEFVDMAKAVDATRHQGRFSASHHSIDEPFDGDCAYVPAIAEEFHRASESWGGVTGDAAKATAETGARIHAALSRALADFIRDVVRPRKVNLHQLQVPS